MNVIKLIPCLLAAAFAGQTHAAGASIFAGISGADESTFGYVGGVYALNGDVATEGMLVRGLLSYGEYDYDTTAVAGGSVEGEATGFELGIGYQWVNPGSRFSIYAGVDHQDHDLSPNDVSNSVNDDETGAQIQAEIETLGTSPWYGSLIGKYSSAFDGYWTRGQLGYKFGSVAVGPEVVLAGNEEYEETRYGVFVNVPVSSTFSVSLSAGHRKAEGDSGRDDQSGGYAGLTLTTLF
jgi:hypothetical protein